MVLISIVTTAAMYFIVTGIVIVIIFNTQKGHLFSFFQNLAGH